MTNAPRERGTAWERRVVDHAQAAGLPWERAPLRGTQDLLDVQGCLPDGWLVGCKAISRRGNLADRLSRSMAEAQAARRRLFSAWGVGRGLPDDVLRSSVQDTVPVQVVQKQGHPVGAAYVVMEYDDFLDLVLERRKWRTQ